MNRETYPYPEPRDEYETHEFEAQLDALERAYANHRRKRENHLSDALDEAIVWLFFIILVFAAVALFAHYMKGR